MAPLAGEGEALRPRPVLFLFNPALLTPEQLRKLFVARHSELDQILDHLRAAGSSPQHVLVLGVRGMGKTTLLLRAAYSLEEVPDLGRQWLAVRFDEEQYNLGELADFWINCLEKIGEDTKDSALLQEVDNLLKELKGEALRDAAFHRLRQYSDQNQRRLLLLVDNIDILLARLDLKEVRLLREILQHQPWLLLVGASASPVVATFDYDSPFYDFFHVIHLEPLGFEAMLGFLEKLGEFTGREDETTKFLRTRQQDLKILYPLTGGNLRTITLLFTLLTEDPLAELGFLLDRLLDQYTSSYRDQIESLPDQGQRVFDALARSWNPATAEDISRELRIDRGAASSQLHRLVDRGLVVKAQLAQRSLAFQVKDRFFNLWYLMRGGRRQRQGLRELLAFLELFNSGHGAEPDQEELLQRLIRLRLLEPDMIEKARKEEARLAQEQPQGGLFADSSIRIDLLALFLLGRFDGAIVEAERYLRAHPDDDFARVLLAHLLEKSGKATEALKVLSAAEGDPSRAWRDLEQARILLGNGDADASTSFILKLLGSRDVDAAELARLAVDVARKGGDKSWMAKGLLNQALSREPGNPDTLLAGCEIELAQDHPKQAIDCFREAVKVSGEAASRKRELLSATLRLATDHPGEVLAALKENGLAEAWLPVANALAYLAGETDKLEKLSPEMRAFAEMVVARIQNTAKPSVAPA